MVYCARRRNNYVSLRARTHIRLTVIVLQTLVVPLCESVMFLNVFLFLTCNLSSCINVVLKTALFHGTRGELLQRQERFVTLVDNICMEFANVSILLG